jgi:hypothetical protein
MSQAQGSCLSRLGSLSFCWPRPKANNKMIRVDCCVTFVRSHLFELVMRKQNFGRCLLCNLASGTV